MNAILGLHAMSAVRSTPYSQPVATERQLPFTPDNTSRLVFLTDPEGLAVERYRLLRRRLCTLHPDGGVVLISSSSPGEGKTLTSINLSWALAEAGHSTCLIDLDFRSPDISRTLRYDFEEGGVQEVLEEKAEIRDLVHKLGDHPLHVLGIRHRISSPGYLFYSQAIQTMMKKLRAMYKWVILDFAPIIPMADVSEMIPHIDGALLVVRTGKTEKDMLTPSMEALSPKLWGVVANDCTINGSTYYGHYGKNK